MPGRTTLEPTMNDTSRHASVIRAIADSDFDLLVCATPAQVRVVSGYWPVMGNSVAAIHRNGKAYLLLPEDEVDLAKATSSAELIEYKPHTLERLTDALEALQTPAEELATRLGGPPGSIGMPFANGVEPGSYVAHNRIQQFLIPLVKKVFPGAALLAADQVLEILEAIKTPDEIAQLRHACDLAARGFAAASEAIVAGRREDEVAADIEAAYLRVAHLGFERGFGRFFCMSGPNSTKAAGAYARTRTRVLEEGDLVMIHANTTGDGIWTDLTRTFTVGQPTAEHIRMRSAIEEARSAALSEVRPGAAASQVDAAARSTLARHGFGPAFKHPTGHGVGFAAANPEAWPRLHPRSPDILAAGMAFNIEPAIYLDGIGGMRHCDVVACTSEGAEVLSRF
jgi:Xaa-Pro aminopeptidase